MAAKPRYIRFKHFSSDREKQTGIDRAKERLRALVREVRQLKKRRFILAATILLLTVLPITAHLGKYHGNNQQSQSRRGS